MNLKAAFITCCCFLLSIYVYAQSPVANFTADAASGCSPIVVNFKDLSTGNIKSWNWDFGNGATSIKQNPSATYFDIGTYSVRLTVSDGTVENTITKTAFITVYEQPKAQFSVDKLKGCTPAIFNFTDNTTTPPGTNVVSWKWDFGDGGSATEQNPKHIYRTPGSYTVTLSIKNDKGCTQIITKPNLVEVIPGVVPSFDFSNPSVCSAPATVSFTNTSQGPGTLTYSWSMGDGGSSFSKNVTHKYTKNGNYAVTLRVASSFGCDDSTTRTVEIGKVNTDFTAPALICPKTSVQLIGNSNPRPIKSVWKFSDGRTDTLRNPFVAFPAGGTYDVTLINTYAVCTDTLTKTITVQAAPIIDFKASDTVKCAPPLSVNFSNNTNDAVSYKWDFGDGAAATSTSATPSYTYTKFGDFDVTLIATNAAGCSDTLKKPAYIKIRKPIIKFPDLPKQGCIPYPVNFIADITTLDKVTSYKWDFGDGGSSTEEKPAYTYTKQGTYTVTLTITTSSGCTETLSLPQAIKVGTRPDPKFTALTFTGCADPGIQFINQTIDTFPPPGLEYFWKFSDGSTDTRKDPLHRFENIGPVTVTLTAINNGCENQITKKDFVTILPSVSRFDYKPDCNDRLLYTFTDKSIQATTWEWNFGDGSPVFTGQNPGSHRFPAKGSYNVSLKTTNGGCVYTLTRTIKITDNTPDFTATNLTGCKPLGTTFTATSPDKGAIKNYTWDFGDGITLTDTKPVNHTYSTAGPFNVTLTSLDSFGCKDVITKNAFIKVYGPVAKFSSAGNMGCKGLTATFIDTSKLDGFNKIVKWTWNYGDTTLNFTYTQPPFQHTYDTIGDFNVKMIVEDAAGCKDSVTKFEYVKISTLKAKWNIQAQTCPGANTSFQNTTVSDFKFTSFWDFGNGATSQSTSAIYTYKDTGYYNIKLKVKDELGCEDSLVQSKAVYVGLPKAAFDANNFTTYCIPFEARFINQSTYVAYNFWDLSTATSNQANPNNYYVTKGTYPIKLVVTSPGGCTDSVTHTLKVFDQSDATISYEPLEGCRPLKVDFEAFSKMKAKFIWDFGDGNVTDTSDNIITHVYDNLGSFVPRIIIIQPEDQNCKFGLVGDKTIEIFGVKAKFALDKTLFCDSGLVHVFDSTITREPIKYYTWNFGDGTISNQPNPTHFYSQPGLYTVSVTAETERGCKDSMTFRPPVKIVASPLISMISDSVICINEFMRHAGVIERQDTSAIKWQWQFPNGNTATVQYPAQQQYTQAGNFTVSTIVTNSSGCADTATRSLLVNPNPVITVPSQITMMLGFPVTIPATYSSNVISYLWTPSTGLSCTDCPTPTANPKMNTKYNIAVVDSNGCKNNADVQIITICKNANIFAPNTFSPNGDGMNDVFFIRGRGIDRVKSLRVFNRWGEVVFEKRDFPINDPAYGWNGRYKNANPHPDVYVYQLEVFCDNSEIIRFEGNIALIQ